jgi:hypothetical protein
MPVERSAMENVALWYPASRSPLAVLQHQHLLRERVEQRHGHRRSNRKSVSDRRQ